MNTSMPTSIAVCSGLDRLDSVTDRPMPRTTRSPAIGSSICRAHLGTVSPAAAANAHPRHNRDDHECRHRGLEIDGAAVEQPREALYRETKSDGSENHHAEHHRDEHFGEIEREVAHPCRCRAEPAMMSHIDASNRCGY